MLQHGVLLLQGVHKEHPGVADPERLGQVDNFFLSILDV